MAVIGILHLFVIKQMVAWIAPFQAMGSKRLTLEAPMIGELQWLFKMMGKFWWVVIPIMILLLPDTILMAARIILSMGMDSKLLISGRRTTLIKLLY